MESHLFASLMLLFASAALAVEFSTEAVTESVPAAGVFTPARSDIECAVKCTAVGSADCSTSVFVQQSGLCLMSAAEGADFSADARGNLVYRRMPTITTKTTTAITSTKSATTTSATTTLTPTSSGTTTGVKTTTSSPHVMISFATPGDRRFAVIQHRSKGNLSFARGWTEYENGFGDDTDFWIGIRRINELTGTAPKLLRVEAVTWSNVLTASEYSNFSVGNASTDYTMTFGSYLSGSSNMSEDALTYHKGMRFSTMDRGSSCSNSF